MIISTEKKVTDQELAYIASKYLANYTEDDKTCELKLGNSETLTIPTSVLPQLREILTQLGKGNSVRIVPIKKELTTTEAAEILNVFRLHIIELLESGKIPFRQGGVHRLILYQDLMNYKQSIEYQRMEVLAELTAQAQELNIGY
jgi:excisionase family DNA binding protein